MYKPGLLFVIAFLASSHAVLAQETTGSFIGNVYDASKAVVPKATVKAISVETRRVHAALTDSNGAYQLPLLPIGSYDLTAEAPGFKHTVRAAIDLHLNESLHIDIVLEVGAVTDTVEVTGQVARVNTEDASMSALFGTDEVANIPSNGRYFNQLVALMPGTVSNIPSGPSSLNFNRAGVSVNGTRYDDNNWSQDGAFNVDTGANGNMNDAASIETVAEFRVLRSNYDAEYGVSGGAQVNVITKSGTREFHGHFQEFLRNNIFDARNFFSATSPPELRFNNPGFTIGGPAYIPKVYNRDRQRTFFFGSMEWQAIRRASPSTATVPLEAMKTGDFGTRSIKDPLTNQNFPNNVIPMSRIDPNALALAKIYPVANRPGSGSNYVIDRLQTIDYFSELIRVDHKLTDKHQLMFRGSRNHYQYNNPAGSFDPFRSARDSILYTWGVTLTSILSPSLINEMQVAKTSGDLPTGPPVDLPASEYGVKIPKLYADTPGDFPLALLHLKSVPDSPPTINVTGYAALAFQNPANSPTHVWQVRDTLSKVIGSHLLKAGMLFHREWKAQSADLNSIGSFTFTGGVTGNGFADFLLGRAQQYSEVDKVKLALVTRKTFEAFINDRWKVNRRLSVTVGVRFSYFGLPQEESGEFSLFVPAIWKASTAPTVNNSGAITNPGDPLDGLTKPDSYLNNLRKKFAPRTGFSWDPFGKGKTVIRGGYGINNTRESFDVEGIRQLNGNPPYVYGVTLFQPLLSNPGIGVTNNAIANLRTVDLNIRSPYYQQWNFGIQHAILPKTVLDIAYVGNKGTDLTRTTDINMPVPNAKVAAGSISANAVRPYLGYGSILLAEPGANSHYNSLQASLTRPFQHGLSVQMNYTWSRAMTDARNNMIDRFNFNLDRGPADFDVPHNFVAVLLYQLPFWRTNNHWYGKSFGGWQLSSITRFSSGQPTDPTLGRDIAGIGGGTQRPQVISNPILPGDQRTPDREFDNKAFVPPATATFATTGIHILRRPGVANWDLSVQKHFRIGEHKRLEVQADAFNAFNHTQFSAIGTGFYGANFGQATAARTAREFQLGMKLRW